MDARQAGLLRQLDPAVLGERIRSLRVAGGLTQSKLAGSDVTVGYISRIEAGQRRPDPRVLEMIAERLGTSAEFLLLGISAREYDELRLGLDFAELALESGDAAEAERGVAQVLEHDAVRTMPELHARARYLRARAAEVQGRLDEALSDLEELAAADDAGQPWLAVGVALSRCYRESGDLTRSIQVGEQMLARLDDGLLGASDEAVQLAVTVAAAYHEQGDTAYATRLCQRAIARADETGSPVARASAYWNASLMEMDRGMLGAAIPLAEKALSLLGEGKDARNLARLRTMLGLLQTKADPPALDDALDNLRRSRAELQASSASAVDLARCDVSTAQALLLKGDADGARELARAAYAVVAESAPLLAADARVVEGQAAAADGDLDAALVAYRGAVAILTGVGADRSAGQLWVDLGALFDDAGDADAARDAYRRAAASVGIRARVASRVPL